MKSTKKLMGTGSLHFGLLAAAVFSIVLIEWKKWPTFAIFDLTLLVLLILWIGAVIKNRSWLIQSNPLTNPLLTFGFAALVSGVFAFDKVGWAGGTLGIFLGILMVHLLAYHIRTKEQILLLFDLLLIGGFVIALFGTYQWLFFRQFIPLNFPMSELAQHGGGIYITSLITDISRTGGYWYFIAPLAISRVLFFSKKENFYQKLFWIAGLVLIIFCIVVGNLKMPLLVLGLTFIYLIIKSKNWRLGLSIFLLMTVISFFTPNFTVERFKVFLKRDYYSQADDRPALQLRALQAWPKNGFLFGTGINNHGGDVNGKNTQAPHNSLLTILGETGLFGAGAFIWLLVSYFRNVPKINPKTDPDLKRMHYSATAVMAGGIIGSMSYHILMGPPTLNIFWVLIAIAMSFKK